MVFSIYKNEIVVCGSAMNMLYVWHKAAYALFFSRCEELAFDSRSLFTQLMNRTHKNFIKQ